MTRYRVPVSNELLASADWALVEGLRFISAGETWHRNPEMKICTFEDDSAPPELEGQLVSLYLAEHRDPAGELLYVSIKGRNVIADAPEPTVESARALLEKAGFLATIRELADAAEDLVRNYGHHPGPCDNDDYDQPCNHHLAAMSRREQRARTALAALDTLMAGP